RPRAAAPPPRPRRTPPDHPAPPTNSPPRNRTLYGHAERRTVLYTVGGSKLYRGDDRRGEPLYSWSGRGWNNQQAALIFAVLIALDLTPVEADT
ncbi:MAG: hypothetical protein AAGJ38_08590, partial [Planctomycetota bacterium]